MKAIGRKYGNEKEHPESIVKKKVTLRRGERRKRSRRDRSIEKRR